MGSQLEAVRDRGVLRCGVDTGLEGFAIRNEEGRWTGFEADLCRAYAAAFLGDARRVEFVPLTTAERFEAVVDGRADILIRNTSWTFARDAGFEVSFAGVYYYDGQGFMTPADLGVSSARELDGARICVQRATTTVLNLNDYAATYDISFTPVERETAAAALESYEAGECDAFTNDISSLAGLRVTLEDPEAHVLLPDVISKEPLGPVVSADDPRFAEAARWVLYALIAAEEYGVTRDNARELAETSRNPEVRRLLGAEGAIGEELYLEPDFALDAIAAVGNYGELFERHLGADSRLGLRRGLNAQWSQGGLLYAPPFR
ncbi:amino acid ABC transporter substrate-binding protein [Marinicauda salina]|uniref:Amino acid ABC transporter substrate-binding protein n=2 Tax=Marinicauda salina TaxID=2135793 RepID=A0A2U2BVK0_9PROT|nr:amino acid ABC transporter substrate-binding protein [Marinicauda salina]